MQDKVMSPPRPPRPLWMVVLSAGLIVGMAMGLRQVMGLYLRPVTMDLGIGREPFSDAMGIANLVWGLCAIFTGMVADKYGSGRVVVACAIATIVGLLLMSFARTGMDLYVSGVLLGVGIAGTGMTALVGAVGRAAPADKRTAAIASLGMAGGIGQLIAFPYTHVLIQWLGWKQSLIVLACTGLTMFPLAWSVSGKPAAATAGIKRQSLVDSFKEAFSHPSYWLLVAGFFVCGFHIAFYSVHLPAFVQDKGLDPWVGVWALMAVGICNIIGTWLAGRSGRLVEKRQGLSFIYFARCFAFIGLLYLPITPLTVIGISALLGLFWLSTIPLTSGLVATFFGTTWMSMLFGVVFLAHQLGSYFGLKLAGRLYDATKSYDMMWWICIALGLFAALVHWPIKERPVRRVLEEAAIAR